MAKAKGSPKYGGRKKGTPNKVTTITRDVIAHMLGNYSDSGLMAQDFAELEPRERLTIAEKLAKYVMPTMQSTAVDLTVQGEGQSLESRLIELSGDDKTT